MIDETDILQKLPQLLPLNSRIAAGAGDDCAVINMPGACQLLAAVDQLIENVHFLPDTPPETAGKKLMNRNLSDIAAMGGTPLTALLTIAVNGKNSVWVEKFISGAAEAGKKFNVPVCGGDTAALPEKGVVATLSILGEIPTGKAVMRSGAQIGDFLYVTGEIGNSFLTEHHLHFIPKLAAGEFLRDHATAMLDISDGLLLDALRLAKASNVTLQLDLDAVPLRTGAQTPGAFSDGEDYELLLTSPRELNVLPDGTKITKIGRVLPLGKFSLVDKENKQIIMDHIGYVHR